MIFFYYGEDSFRAQQKIQAIVDKFFDKVDQTGYNIVRLDGETMKADEFWQAISTVGFLADKKLIIVKNIFDNKQLKDWQPALLDFLNKQTDRPEANYVIFWQTAKPDSRTKLYKALVKFKYVEEFTKLRPNELNAWIIKQAKKYKKDINLQAINLLLNYIGNNLWQLDQEIAKLANYSKEEISEEDVKTLVQAKIDENIFNLVDSLANKDKASSLQLIEDKLNSGINHQYILTMIIRQFRLLIKAKSLAEAKSPGDLGRALKLPPIVANKILAQSQKYSLEQLKIIYQELLNLDEKFKSTDQSPNILLDQMIYRL